MLLFQALVFAVLFAVTTACGGTRSQFQGVGGITIDYVEIPTTASTTVGGLLFLTGRGEGYLQFCEFANDMIGEGYDIYMMDVRGQGLSGRLLEDPVKGHLDDWAHYVTDVKTMVDTIIKPKHSKVVGVAHSQGASIFTTYAQTYDDFTALVMSSPMHQVNTEPYTECQGQIIACFFTYVLCQGEEYTIIQGAYNPDEDTFEGNVATHDPERFKQKKEVFQQFPIGGPTNGYFVTTFAANQEMRKNASKLNLPVLMLQSELDQTVVNSAQDQVCNDAPDCTKIVMQGAFHNLFWELDEIRSMAIETHMKGFLRGI